MEKEEFMSEYGKDKYGYPNSPLINNIDDIRATQFNRLNGLVYLDHAGATLYSELQMEAIFKDLTGTVFGNPHSQSECSFVTSNIIREARQQVLDFCNASHTDYKCIFTSGATAGLKLVGEAFPWSNQSNFMYTMENHNSLLGIREYALAEGATACAIDIEEAEHCCRGFKTASSIKVLQHPMQRRNEAKIKEAEPAGDIFNLFAFPSECNFSGTRYSLDLVNFIKEDHETVLEGSPLSKGHWMVLIDAAKGCATDPPDLSKYRADFVVVSFYKLFGYPTGCGALIVRNEAAKLMKRKYFSGGTVASSIADIDFVKRRDGIEESFEDGTISFLSLAAIKHGFKALNTLTMPAIFRHTNSIATYVRAMLLALRHENGASVCILYGHNKSKVLYEEMGPIVSFNLKRPDGSWFGYREVEKLACLSEIQLRTGCFCNPGACAKYLGLSNLDLLSNIEAGHVCWDDHDIVLGKPTGAVRVSFGYMSTFEDANKFVSFIKSSFVAVPALSENRYISGAKPNSFSSEGETNKTARYWLRSITVYPIKSCAGFRVNSWPLSSSGLIHDREWLLKGLNGEILTQKKVPEMCFISTYIDLKLGILHVESPRCKTKLQIKLKTHSFIGTDELNVYTQRYKVHGYDTEVDTWFSKAVGRPCALVQCYGSKNVVCLNTDERSGVCRDMGTRLNFVNEAQFLLISEESVADLSNRLTSNEQEDLHDPLTKIDPMRFRPNLVISGGTPYAEDKWRSLKIGHNCFVSLGGCNRCQMINLNPEDGNMIKSREPLATLASYRRVKGKILFGILLRCTYMEEQDTEGDSWLRVGQELLTETD